LRRGQNDLQFHLPPNPLLNKTLRLLKILIFPLGVKENWSIGISRTIRGKAGPPAGFGYSSVLFSGAAVLLAVAICARTIKKVERPAV
jgi:hypothetical protein